MRIQRLLFLLTVVNLALLAFLLVRIRAVEAGPDSAVLRGRGLEIVDDQGRVRASIQTLPGDPTFKMPDGRIGYSETVILRLSTPDGKPRVKLTTSDRGSGLMLLGDSDDTYTILKADDAKTTLLLRNTLATQKVLGP